METITIDFRDTVVKPADLPRAVEALRRHYAGAIAQKASGSLRSCGVSSLPQCQRRVVNASDP